ncbi:MAG: type IV pilus biogenesis/stability protein PilW [Gammaproteobacteria bacterium]|nr:type IV pilus biogenesis/stability protein PilW [Gammaproteobacteria bacterium]
MPLALALVMAGCQTQSVREVDGGATGELGSPTAQAGPADVYIELAGAYLRQGQLTEALRNARKAVIVDAKNANAHYVLGLVQQRLGQFDLADEAYRKAIAVDPRNPEALNAYGSFLCDRGRYDDADSYFRQALQNPLYQSPWMALHNAGWCRQRAGDAGAAETDFRAALRTNPEFAPSLLSMGELSFDKGVFLSARAYLQRFAEVAPATAESLWLGVRTERQLGDATQAARYAQALRLQFPDSEQARYLQTIE